MSREGAPHNIDSLLDGVGSSNRYKRTALGNAVRYSTMLNLLEEDSNRPEGRQITNSRELVDALDVDINQAREEYNDAVNDAFNRRGRRGQRTVQQAASEAAYNTRLGRTIARETAYNAARSYGINNNPTQFGTSYAANSFFGSFVRGDDDFFGSKVLYDNVFGPHLNDSHNNSLSQRDSNLGADDVENDYALTASQKVLGGIVRRSLDDADFIVDRLDLEFTRFQGESLLDQYSLTGSGLRSSRETIRRVQASGTAGERARLAAGDDSITSINREKLAGYSHEEVRSALDDINTLYQNRSSGAPASEIVNKAGVQTFVELFNSSKNRISIQGYQFQNDTISAAFLDVVKRRVLEAAIEKNSPGTEPGKVTPFVVDFTIASPINREGRLNEDNQLVRSDVKHAVGATTYAILGPNIIETLKLQEVRDEIFKFLEENGLATDNIEDYLQLNIQYRDRKYHPKLYMSDTMAAIGSQNLTGPVGNSINQAGSNFEQMYVVRDRYYGNTSELTADRNLDNQGVAQKYKLRGQQEIVAKNRDIRASLLFRQIQQLSDFERNASEQGYQGYGLLHRRGQVGLSGDVYEHLKDTLNFTAEYYRSINNTQTSAPGQEVKAGGGKYSMYFVLDQAFLLQSGDTSFAKQKKGEMGHDYSSNRYKGNDKRTTKYQKLQDKLSYLLTINQAQVVVDAKNYQEQVYNPLIKKIEANQELLSNYNKFGRNLGLMAGNAIFGPKTAEQYDSSVTRMMGFLRAQGFTKKAGFTDRDLKQIIAIGSGNIQSASVPKQHAKMAALFEKTNEGQQMKSFITGSSNFGMYSLGIPSGIKASAADFSSVNTEMGVMLGTNVTNAKGQTVNLSRVPRVGERPESVQIAHHDASRAMNITDYQADWSLNQEQEQAELMLMQERFVQTYSELGNNRITNPDHMYIKNTPMWQDNVNAGSLVVLKNRLEKMKSDMGITDSAFKISERIENNKTVSYNVTIDMARVLGEKGFLSASADMPKFQFEISVLNGPNRGSNLADDRTAVPGMVYFVGKNKLVGNGIFVNDSSQSIEVLGRHNYEDGFEEDLHKGRVTLQSGEKAHLSSLDIVPQMFGTIMAEGMQRFAVQKPLEIWSGIQNSGQERQVIEEYLAKSIFGVGTHIKDVDGVVRDYSSREMLLNHMQDIEPNEVLGRLTAVLSNQETGGGGIIRQLMKSRLNLFGSKTFNSDTRTSRANDVIAAVHKYAQVLDPNIETNVDKVKAFDDLITSFRNLIHVAPELVNEVVKYGYQGKDFGQSAQAYKDYVGGMFDPFLQGGEDRTYGGQQGFYRTVLLGLAGNSGHDEYTAKVMRDLDPNNPSAANMMAYARFQGLAYNTTTDLHEHLYRSIASKSTSMTTMNSDMDSLLFMQEARMIGQASNLGLLESIGIGTKTKAEYYIVGNNGEIDLSESVKEVLSAMTKDNPTSEVAEQVKENLIKAYSSSSKFGASVVDGNVEYQNNNLLMFYTGGKLTQLPQRIKNAMGARPLMQYSMQAQRAIEGSYGRDEAFSVADLTKSYMEDNRTRLENLVERRTKAIMSKGNYEQLKTQFNYSSDVSDFDVLQGLNVATANMFKRSQDGLGAVFGGRVKTVMSQEQLAHVMNKRKQLETLFVKGNEEIKKEDEELLNEILRVELIKDSINSSGLGQLVSGNERFKYTMVMVQLSGVYTDTFLANPLYGTTYSDSETYMGLKMGGHMANGVSDDMINKGYVMNRGMREGYFETQTKSIKSSMIGEGGANYVMKKGDRIVEMTDKGPMARGQSTGRFVVQRFENGSWNTVTTNDKVILTLVDGSTRTLDADKVPNSLRELAVKEQRVPGAPLMLDDKRNIVSITNLVDNTSFSGVGTPSLGGQKSTAYGRVGEMSEDYLYDMEFRQGNFSTNEYTLFKEMLRSVVRGGGSRVEGTNASALVKGVANFAGMTAYSYTDKAGQLQKVNMNLFQSIESQLYDFQSQRSLGGSTAFMLNNIESGRNFGNSSPGFNPLSSMIHGMYNTNNFKSFFWSHGAAIITDNVETPGIMSARNPSNTSSRPLTLLDNLMAGGFSGKDGVKTNVDIAKRMLGGLVLAFGDDFLTVDKSSAVGGGDQLRQIKSGLIAAMERGEYGDTYKTMVSAQKILLTSQERINQQGHVNATELLNEKVYDAVKAKGVYNELNLGALSMITADEALGVLRGDLSAANSLVGKVGGLLNTAAEKARVNGGSITLGGADGFINRQAAHVATAIDLFQQMASQNNVLRIPSEVDIRDDKVRQTLMGIAGVGELSDSEKEGLMQMIEGASTQINAVTMFGDITFSQSKDPVSTQTVSKHEGQHLIVPFLGDISKFQEGGQMDRIQHTMASLISLASGSKSSGLVYGSQMNMMSFSQAQATNLRDAKAHYMFSPFQSQKFLGFYQGGALEAHSRDFTSEFKKVTESIAKGGFIDTDNGRVTLHTNGTFTQEGIDDVSNYVRNIKGLKDDRADADIQRLLSGSYEAYASEKLESLERELAVLNNKYQADPTKGFGANTKEFLAGMKNETMFFAMPTLKFDYQSGAIVARATDTDMYTFLPSAQIMRELGAQHQDFIDPVMNNYKTLASLFTPGHIASKAFQKVLTGMNSGAGTVLSNAEAQALSQVMQAAERMPIEIEKALGSQRMQQAASGKTKYQGFTSIGIGSLLVPGGGVVLPQAKLDEAGLGELDQRKMALINSFEQAADVVRPTYQKAPLDKLETTLIKLGELSGVSDIEGGVRPRIENLFSTGQVDDSGRTVLSQAGARAIQAYDRFHRMRKASIYARTQGISTDKRIVTITAMLNNLDTTFDQLNNELNRQGQTEDNIASIKGLRDEIGTIRQELLNTAAEEFGLKKQVLQVGEGDALIYREFDQDRYEISLYARKSRDKFGRVLTDSEGKPIYQSHQKKLQTDGYSEDGKLRILPTEVVRPGYSVIAEDGTETVVQKQRINAKFSTRNYTELGPYDRTYVNHKGIRQHQVLTLQSIEIDESGVRATQIRQKWENIGSYNADGHLVTYGDSNTRVSLKENPNQKVKAVQKKVNKENNLRLPYSMPNPVIELQTPTTTGHKYAVIYMADTIEDGYKPITTMEESVVDYKVVEMQKGVTVMTSAKKVQATREVDSKWNSEVEIKNITTEYQINEKESTIKQKGKGKGNFEKTISKKVLEPKTIKSTERVSSINPAEPGQTYTQTYDLIQPEYGIDENKVASLEVIDKQRTEVNEVTRIQTIDRETRRGHMATFASKEEAEEFIANNRQAVDEYSRKVVEAEFNKANKIEKDNRREYNKARNGRHIMADPSIPILESRQMNEQEARNFIEGISPKPTGLFGTGTGINSSRALKASEAQFQRAGGVVSSIEVNYSSDELTEMVEQQARKDQGYVVKNPVNRQVSSLTYGEAYDPILKGVIDGGFTDVDKDDYNNIRLLNRQAVDLISNGMSDKGLRDYKSLQRQAITARNKMEDLSKALSHLNSEGGRDTFDKVYGATSALLNNLKSEIVSLRDNNPNDRYIYSMAEANITALEAQLGLARHSADKTAPDEHTMSMQRRALRFAAVSAFLNPQDSDGMGLFSGLGMRQSEIGVQDLHNQKLRGASESSVMVGDDKVSIISQLKQVDAFYSETGIDPSKAEADKRSLSNSYITELISRYEQERKTRQAVSNARSGEVLANSPVNGEKQYSDVDKQARIEAAYEDQNNRLDNIIEELKSLKEGFSQEGADFVGGFRKARNIITRYDDSNGSMIEFFRSPTPGGTDPRMHTYRAMQGVSAFNRVIMTINNQIEGANTGENAKLLLDETRNSTATYVGSVGIVTYGGGDYDGDPYTTIFHKAADFNNKVMQAKGAANLANQKVIRLNQEVEELKKNGGSPQKIAELEHLAKVEAENAKTNQLAYQESLVEYKGYAKYGKSNMTARTRKQVANFLGIDERHFISIEGEAVLNEQGEEIDRKYGFANKTAEMDSMFALLNTGYGLYDKNIGNQGSKMMNLYRNIDAIVGFDKGTQKDSLTFLRNLSKGIKVDPESGKMVRASREEVLRQQLDARLLTDTGLDKDQSDFIRNLLKPESEAELKSLASMLESMARAQEQDSVMRRGLDNLENEAEVDYAHRKAFVSQFIGGKMFASMQANSKMQKLMALGSNDIDVNESMYSLLSQSLGKAGGEILGKAYNTIIGTTFQDASIISLGRAMQDRESESGKSFYEASVNAYKKYTSTADADEIDFEVDKRLEGADVSAEERAKVRQRVIDDRALDFVNLSEKAMRKSESVQGFAKNIHQILRDSIKLKNEGKEQRDELVKRSSEYEEYTEKISQISRQISSTDSEDTDTLSTLQETKRSLMNSRDNVIEGITSKLGPGAGLKSLMNLDLLINASSSGGLTREQYSRMIGDGIDSAQSRYQMDQLGISESERVGLGNLSSNEANKTLAKVARYKTAKDITSMVASYRFENRIEQSKGDALGISNVNDLALSHKRRMAAEHYQQSINSDMELKDVLAMQKDSVSLTNKFADGNPSDANKSVESILTSRYITGDVSSKAGGINDSNYREALAIHLGVDMDKFYASGGQFDSDQTIGGQKVQNILTEGLSAEAEKQLLIFDSIYRESAESSAHLFGKDGERLEEFTTMENVRKNMSRSLMGDETAFEDMGKTNPLLQNLDTEMITTMGQLIAQNKLGASGVDTFAMMYQGVVSSLLEADGGEFNVRRANPSTGQQEEVKVAYNDLNPEEKSRIMMKKVLGAIVGTSDEGPSRHTSDDAREFSRVQLGMLDDDDYLDAYQKQMRGSLSDSESKLLAQMGDQLLLQMVDEGGDNFDKLLDTFVDGASDARHSADGGANSNREQQKERIRKYMGKERIRIMGEHQAQQKSRRAQLLEANPMLRRGAFMNKVSTGAASLLATNKVSNSLDLLVPLAITAFGQSIGEGSVDDDSLQRLAGTAISSFNNARPGFIDDPNAARLRGRQQIARGLTSVFKFRNAMNRHDGNYAMAAADVAVMEGTSMVVNHMLAPKANRLIANKMFGAGNSPGMRALNMDKYVASQQLAGNIGSSLISAASTAIISGILMRNVVQPISQQAAQVIQNFQPAADYQSQANAEIARRRAQENAYEEMVTVQTGNAEEEISAYNVDTNATYGEYNQSAAEDLMAAQEIEPTSFGNLGATLLS